MVLFYFSELCPNVARYYGNRSACYMMMGLYRDALKDAQKCIELDPKFIKVIKFFHLTRTSLLKLDFSGIFSSSKMLFDPRRCCER